MGAIYTNRYWHFLGPLPASSSPFNVLNPKALGARWSLQQYNEAFVTSERAGEAGEAAGWANKHCVISDVVRKSWKRGTKTLDRSNYEQEIIKQNERTFYSKFSTIKISMNFY